MSKIKVVLSAILLTSSIFASTALGDSAKFSWLPNPEPNLAGYKIHYGLTNDGVYTHHVDITSLTPAADGRIHGTVDGLDDGNTYYFACTAYNTSGIESNPSTEVIYTAIYRPTLINVEIREN